MSKVLQVVDDDGSYQTEAVEAFVRDQNLENAGVNYQIVAIMGPQSSGKSTLLNAVFNTSFTEMNALEGRSQTTHGIWLARSSKLASPATLVMDLEGSDGRERGEDDTSFERQSALFALATADVLLINMWAKDVGREVGAGKPLLKVIFQVNLKLFTPAAGKRRTVLLFVFRDRTRTPLVRLVEAWDQDLARLWAAIPKPPEYDGTSVADFFEVKYSAMPNFEEHEHEFNEECILLRKRFTVEDKESLVRVSNDKLPAAALSLSTSKVWEVIRSQKDLNLPAHRVMVANIRCAEIAADQLAALQADQAWLSLKHEVEGGLLPGFGARVGGLLDSNLAGYDAEAEYFESGVRGEKRAELLKSLRSVARPLYDAQLTALSVSSLAGFKLALTAALAEGSSGFASAGTRLASDTMAAFEEGAVDVQVPDTAWSPEATRAALEDDIAVHALGLKQRKIADVEAAAVARMSEALAGPAIALLDCLPPDLWNRLKRLYDSSLEQATALAAEGLEGYDLDAEENTLMEERLAAAGQQHLMLHVREAAHTALSRIKDKFNEAFTRDEAGMPRAWTSRVNIGAVTQAARSQSAQCLALLALFRLEVPPSVVHPVEAAILSLAAERQASSLSSSTALSGGGSGGLDILASAQWPGVAAQHSLLSPGQCRSLWRQFLSDSIFTVQQAMSTQEANRAASNMMPPLWAAAAIVLLGWNEFVTVLYNPLWLLIGIVIFLFGKTVYEEMEVDAEMQNGLLPGALALSAKFLPTMKGVARRSAASVQRWISERPAHSESSAREVEMAALPHDRPDTDRRSSAPGGHRHRTDGNGGTRRKTTADTSQPHSSTGSTDLNMGESSKDV